MSSQKLMAEAMTFVPPGWMRVRPTVATALASVAAARVGISPITREAATTGSARWLIGVVPAWLPWPAKEKCQRPWPMIEDPMATA
jgi:hypothetical protein